LATIARIVAGQAVGAVSTEADVPTGVAAEAVDVAGKDVDGPDTDGPDTDGPDTDGPDTDGPDTDGPDTDGPDTDGPACRAPDEQPPITATARRPATVRFTHRVLARLDATASDR
jgi:hypothetical protein